MQMKSWKGMHFVLPVLGSALAICGCERGTPQEEQVPEVALRCVDMSAPSIWFTFELDMKLNTARLNAFASSLYGDSGSVSVSPALYSVAVPLLTDSSTSNVVEIDRITGEAHLTTVDSEGALARNTIGLTLACEEIDLTDRL